VYVGSGSVPYADVLEVYPVFFFFFGLWWFVGFYEEWAYPGAGYVVEVWVVFLDPL